MMIPLHALMVVFIEGVERLMAKVEIHEHLGIREELMRSTRLFSPIFLTAYTVMLLIDWGILSSAYNVIISVLFVMAYTGWFIMR